MNVQIFLRVIISLLVVKLSRVGSEQIIWKGRVKRNLRWDLYKTDGKLILYGSSRTNENAFGVESSIWRTKKRLGPR